MNLLSPKEKPLSQTKSTKLQSSIEPKAWLDEQQELVILRKCKRKACDR